MNGKKYLGAALLSFAAAQAGAATLTATASPNPANVGQSVAVAVQIIDVPDLFTYQFSISFDPTVLQATSVALGDILVTGGTSFGAPGAIDNSAGTISFFYNTLIGPISGVTGSGTLANITFQAVGAGSSTFGFTDIMLLNSGGEDIAFGVANPRVDVSAVPEPATYAMLGVGLIGVAALRRRQLAATRS